MSPPFIVARAPQHSSKQNGPTKSSNSKRNGLTKKGKLKSSINSKESIVREVFRADMVLGITPLFKMFTFEELKSATMNFRADMVLGEGGFGKVFKGWVDEMTYAPSNFGAGIAVAIKKSNPESLQGLNEWESEVEFSRNLSHPNIIKLLGSCREDREFLLVYEYMQNGSLDSQLFNDGLDPLPWGIRLKVAIGAARGLAFLHASERPVIFRDFKTTNILLDGDYNAKLSDFGLAMFNSTNCGTDVKKPTNITSTLDPTNGDTQVSTQISWSNGDTQVITEIRGLLSTANGDSQVTTQQISLPNGDTQVTTHIRGILGLTNNITHITTRIGGMLDPVNGNTHVTTQIKTCPANGNTHVTTKIKGALSASNGDLHVTTQMRSALIPASSSSQVTTRVMGTYGYAAPEYVATGHLYVKSDVYGFGVVFLELLTGLRALDINRPREMQNLIEWARSSLSSKRNVKKIMDPRLGDQYPPEDAYQAAQLALKCLENEPRKRPSMEEVLKNLEQINTFEEENKGAQSHSDALSSPTPRKTLWKWDLSSFTGPCKSFLTRMVTLRLLVLL